MTEVGAARCWSSITPARASTPRRTCSSCRPSCSTCASRSTSPPPSPSTLTHQHIRVSRAHGAKQKCNAFTFKMSRLVCSCNKWWRWYFIVAILFAYTFQYFCSTYCNTFVFGVLVWYFFVELLQYFCSTFAILLHTLIYLVTRPLAVEGVLSRKKETSQKGRKAGNYKVFQRSHCLSQVNLTTVIITRSKSFRLLLTWKQQHATLFSGKISIVLKLSFPLLLWQKFPGGRPTLIPCWTFSGCCCWA